MSVEMKTTLREIWDKDPCGKNSDTQGWGLLTKSLGTDDLDTEVSLMQILNSNRIVDAIWALRCFDYKDYCLFLSDVSESVLHIFESQYADDMRVRNCIKAIRDYHEDNITSDNLRGAADAAANAAYAAYDAANAANAANAAYDAAVNASYAASYAAAKAAAKAAAYAANAANAAAKAASYAAYVAADVAADAAADAAAYAANAAADARKNKWKEIEQLFLKHFGE